MGRRYEVPTDLRRHISSAEQEPMPDEVRGASLLLGLAFPDAGRRARVRRWLVGGVILSRIIALALMTAVTVLVVNFALGNPTGFNLAVSGFVLVIEAVLAVVVVRAIIGASSRRA